MKNGLILGVMCIFLNTLYAKTDCPIHFKPVDISKLSQLDTDEASIFLLFNKSDEDMWVTHTVENPSASAGWASYLNAGHGSALYLDKKSFKLSCIETKPGHEQITDCKYLLRVCQSKAYHPTNKTGSAYWVIENKSLKHIQQTLIKKGLLKADDEASSPEEKVADEQKK